METTHTIKECYPFSPFNDKERMKMMKKFHGIDRHKHFSTISVLNQEGHEVSFVGVCRDLKEYVAQLEPTDAVVLEASTGSFWWSDRIEERGASCYILDPFKFKIIKESWNKTDKRDARNMAKALWVYLTTGEFGIPTVYKPEAVIREFRRLFSEYTLIKKQISMHKNNIQAILVDNGVVLTKGERYRLFSAEQGLKVLTSRKLSPASRTGIIVSLEVLWKLQEMKENISDAIIGACEPLQEKVKVLMSIKGISALIALAFLADVGDVRRFRTLRKMNAYLGVVPKEKGSGGKRRPGHINRESRKLTRTLLTQTLVSFVDASPQFRKYYDELKIRRGAGRARIALIRKLCGIMRRMLLNNEEFRFIKVDLYESKLKIFEKKIESSKEVRGIA